MSALNGIVDLYKPTGITSAKALYQLRSITGQRKSGHAGTLDPMAAGVLVVCLGKATKLVESIMDQPKVYRAAARLDVVSDSHDRERPMRSVDVREVPQLGGVQEACRSFEGWILQVPPQISAVKVAGQPAYKRAARGQQMALRPRPVRIYWMHIYAYSFPELDFQVCCGRGTYVRSLIRDLGRKLGTGGCLTSLTRQLVGPFSEAKARPLDAIRTANAPDEYLLAMDLVREWLDPTRMTIPPRPQDTQSLTSG